MYINIGWNVETYISILVLTLSILGLIYFFRLNWKKYGLLFLLSSIVGNILCYTFVKLGFYSYPYRLFPTISVMPVTTISTVFPLVVLIGVRYSPRVWGWKIPFYWVIVHIGMFFETYASNNTDLIRYDYKWDLWDSYTWWWIFVLVFEWIGGLIIPNNLRKPINIEKLKFGKLGWAIIHFILIITIFLGGYYLGTLK